MVQVSPMQYAPGISTGWLMPLFLSILLFCSNNLAKAQYSLGVYGYIPIPASGKTSTGVDFSQFADLSFGTDILFRYQPEQVALGFSGGFATLGIDQQSLLKGSLSDISIRRVYPIRLRIFTALAHLDYEFKRGRKRKAAVPWVGAQAGIAWTEYSIVQFPNVGVLYDDKGSLSFTTGVKGGVRFRLSDEIKIDVGGDYSFLFLRERTMSPTEAGRYDAEQTGRQIRDVTLPHVVGGTFSVRLGVIYKLDI